jgi:A/G-specific adenine glycosylase
MKLWEGLGYYRRAKHLHETAKILAGKRKMDKKLLSSCPGIGDYTLAAVSSIVWGEPLAVVDGNVKRVIARFLGLRESIDGSVAQEKSRRAADEWLYRKASGDWNQAMMELGAMVCTPHNPLCSQCPLSFGCAAFKSGDQENLPVKSKKAPRPHRRMASAVITSEKNDFLILKRPNRGLLSNLWEFPNIEIGKSEDIGGQLKHHLLKQGLQINVEKKIAVVDHAYSHFSVTMEAFFCRLVNGGADKLNHGQKSKWVSAQKLASYPFPKVHKPVLALLEQKQNLQTQATS